MSKRATRKSKSEYRRPRQVTSGGLLLLVEGLGLGLLSPYNYPADLVFQISAENPLHYILYRMLATSMYAFLAVMALMTAISFLRLGRTAWGNAVILQGLVLLSALAQYFGSHPPYVYPQMLLGIFMVIYLHYQDVQAPFEQRTPGTNEEAGHA